MYNIGYEIFFNEINYEFTHVKSSQECIICSKIKKKKKTIQQKSMCNVTAFSVIACIDCDENTRKKRE